MDWIRLYTAKWLFGSGRNMTPEKRGVWADLLALAAEAKLRDGTLRFDVGQPMTRDYIAGILRIDRSTLDACLDVFTKDINTDDGLPRVTISEDGTIALTNFNKYQEPRRKGNPSEEQKDQMATRRAVKKPEIAHKAEAINGNSVVNPSGEIVINPNVMSAMTIYQQNIGEVTPLLKADIERLLCLYSVVAFQEACREAVRAGVCKMSYIEAVLQSKSQKHQNVNLFSEAYRNLGQRYRLKEITKAEFDAEVEKLKKGGEV